MTPGGRPPHPRTFQDDEILTVPDLADILGISVRSAYRIVASPGFPKVILSAKAYRIAGWQFRQWLNQEAARAATAAVPVSAIQRGEQARRRHHPAPLRFRTSIPEEAEH